MADFSSIDRPLTGLPRMRKGERTRYVPNHRSFGAFIKSDQMRDVTEEVATDIAAAAAAAMPASDDGEGLRSDIKGGFQVQKSKKLMKVGGNLRVRVDVLNNVAGSALFEFGANNIPRLRMLGRAGAKFGDFKPEDGPR